MLSAMQTNPRKETYIREYKPLSIIFLLKTTRLQLQLLYFVTLPCKIFMFNYSDVQQILQFKKCEKCL